MVFNFFACDGGGEGPQLQGNTMAVAIPSNGSVSQLAMDALIATAYGVNDDSKSPLTRLGYFETPLVHPVVGYERFARGDSVDLQSDGRELCVGLELFRVAKRSLILLQQRAPVLKGKGPVFAKELVAWATSVGISRIIFLAGAEHGGREDMLLPNRRLAYTTNNALPEDLNGVTSALEGLGLERRDFDIDEEGGGVPPQTGVLRHMLRACKHAQLPAVALIMHCTEGDNLHDAMTLAAAADRVLGPVAEDSSSKQGLRTPASWAQLYGRPQSLEVA